MLQGIVAKFARNDDGATSIEYALIASIVAVAIVASLKLVSNSLQNNLNGVANGFANAK